MNSKNVNLALRERIKELKCLYELSRIAWDSGYDLEKILTKLTKILPAAMQHSTIARARIEIDGSEFFTRGYEASPVAIHEKVHVDGKTRGTLSVVYVRNKGTVGALTFLQEERRLLKTISREVSLILKKVSMEEERHKLESKLQHVERLAFVGELSAGIAHELNEPLGRILGFAQLIRKGGPLSAQQNEDVERIIKASLLTREIIKKLMLFSRQMPQQLTSVNLNEVVENILYFIDVGYPKDSIHVESMLDKSLPEIQADAVQMSQVLVNLITNAVHAMPKGGTLTIKTSHKGEYVKLRVIDTGMGMSKETKSRLFEPFFTTKPLGQGTGLGLSVVHGIVESHGGRITVKSEEQKGSTFEIALPIHRKKQRK
jgi:Signal transduction histidine kinase